MKTIDINSTSLTTLTEAELTQVVGGRRHGGGGGHHNRPNRHDRPQYGGCHEYYDYNEYNYNECYDYNDYNRGCDSSWRDES